MDGGHLGNGPVGIKIKVCTSMPQQHPTPHFLSNKQLAHPFEVRAGSLPWPHQGSEKGRNPISVATFELNLPTSKCKGSVLKESFLHKIVHTEMQFQAVAPPQSRSFGHTEFDSPNPRRILTTKKRSWHNTNVTPTASKGITALLPFTSSHASHF